MSGKVPTVDLRLGDCLEVMKTLPDGCVDAVVTDPPYGIAENSGRRLHAYRNPEKSQGKIGWNNMADATAYGDTRWDDAPLSPTQWDQITRMAETRIVFGANHLQGILGKAGSIIVWDKKCKNGWDDFFSDCELIWCSIVQPDKVYRQLWMGALRGGGEERVHPTQKPLALMAWLISRYTPDGATVLDPFMGSGTTGVACVQTGRNFIGIEIDPGYFEIAKKRIEEAQLQMRMEI